MFEMVFSAFGFVHKITTFEKTAGFQALVQFSDTETATSAKDALDGRSIPRYLLSENIARGNLKSLSSAEEEHFCFLQATAGSNNGSSCSSIQWDSIGQPMMPPQPSAGWASGVPGVPQSTPVQMTNHPYMPPASMPQMTPGNDANAGRLRWHTATRVAMSSRRATRDCMCHARPNTLGIRGHPTEAIRTSYARATEGNRVRVGRPEGMATYVLGRACAMQHVHSLCLSKGRSPGVHGDLQGRLECMTTYGQHCGLHDDLRPTLWISPYLSN
ncbi:hypothetical protein F3Y22_tig00013960pilonHSYRG00108 [Hibiscus syriacus]|uniref:Uncharacterized protein n=1 Tax=Hibiscus syriacus TaxID=106335 RepID=A0A6A3C355_HIBSY|nr:hypothetical protein F3Y22_tig00013960pilonHSYRG00108 [Hibiscus syriacus]